MKKLFFLIFIIIICPVLAHAQAIGNQGSSKAYADAQDAITLAAAEDYADGLDAANSAADQAYTDSVTANMADITEPNVFTQTNTFPAIVVANPAGLPGILSIPSSYAPAPFDSGDGQFYLDGILVSRVDDTATEIVGGSDVWDIPFTYSWNDTTSAEWAADLAADFTSDWGTVAAITTHDSTVITGSTYTALDFSLTSSDFNFASLKPDDIVFAVTDTDIRYGVWLDVPAAGPNGGVAFTVPTHVKTILGSIEGTDFISVGVAFAETTGAPTAYVQIKNNDTSYAYVSAIPVSGKAYLELVVSGPTSVEFSARVNGVEFATEATTSNAISSGTALAIRDFSAWSAYTITTLTGYFAGGGDQSAIVSLLDTNLYRVEAP